MGLTQDSRIVLEMAVPLTYSCTPSGDVDGGRAGEEDGSYQLSIYIPDVSYVLFNHYLTL